MTKSNITLKINYYSPKFITSKNSFIKIQI